MMMTGTKNETKSQSDGTISYKSLYFVKPSLELEPLFTERDGKSFRCLVQLKCLTIT